MCRIGRQSRHTIEFPHRLGEWTPARHDDQSAPSGRGADRRADRVEALRNGRKTSADLDHGERVLDFQGSCGDFPALPQSHATVAAGAVRAAGPNSSASGRTFKPAARAASAAMKSPRPATTAVSISGHRRRIRASASAMTCQLGPSQRAGDVIDVRVVEHLPVGTHNPRQALPGEVPRGGPPIGCPAAVVLGAQMASPEMGVAYEGKPIGRDARLSAP